MNCVEAFSISARTESPIRHRYFDEHEWLVVSKDHRYVTFEDGVMITRESFWNLRTDESWNRDWEIFTTPSKQQLP